MRDSNLELFHLSQSHGCSQRAQNVHLPHKQEDWRIRQDERVFSGRKIVEAKFLTLLCSNPKRN